MSLDNDSRNLLNTATVEVATAASVAPPRNLHELREAIAKLGLLPKLRGELMWAINAVADTAAAEGQSRDESLTKVLLDKKTLESYLARAVGARAGYARETWYNIRRLVRKAARMGGAWPAYCNRTLLMTTEWRERVRQMPAYSRFRLLANWASINNIPPDRLSDDHTEAFFMWLSHSATQQYAWDCYRGALNHWNLGVRTGWSGRELLIKSRRREHYSYPLDRWSETVHAEIERIRAELERPDPDGELGFRPIKQQSSRTYAVGLYRLLSAYCRATGVEPEAITSVRALIDPKALKPALDYQLDWIRRRKPNVTTASDVYNSARVVSIIAQRIYASDLAPEIIRKFKRMSIVRRPKRSGMTQKNRELLRRFDDESFEARFLNLPARVFERVLKREKLRRTDIAQLTCAFAMAQQIKAPLRPHNQKALCMGEHIFLVEQGGKKFLAIRIAGWETKTEVDFDFLLSGTIVNLYETYVTRVRRPTDGCTLLYPGENGAMRSSGNFSQQLATFVENELGDRITAQQFRHVVGYLYLRENPGDFETVRKFLGHKDIATTIEFYAGLSMRMATGRVGSFLDDRTAKLGRRDVRRRPKKK